MGECEQRSALDRQGGGPLFGGRPDLRRPGGWRALLFPAVWLVYLAQTAGGVADHASGAAAVAGYAGLALFAAGYVVALSLTRVGSRRYWCIAIAMTLLTAGEAVIAHEDALVMCVFLAVLLMAGLVLDGRNAEAAAGIAVLTTVSAFVPA
ncbi:MAG TPA: hypothetical protein VM844_07830, partial [Miltoncostaeaceae bacterium]|nr:hypothetical protein [Miltoncostaeaceae bacterium]